MSQTMLEQTQLHTLLKAFFEQHRDEYGLQTLGYFNSSARGETGEASDIDIVPESDSLNLFMTEMLKQSGSD